MIKVRVPDVVDVSFVNVMLYTKKFERSFTRVTHYTRCSVTTRSHEGIGIRSDIVTDGVGER